LNSWKRSNRILWLMAASMLLLLVVAACSSDDSGTPSITTTAPAQVAPAQAPVAAAPAPTQAPAAAAAAPVVNRMIFATNTPTNEHSDQRMFCCFDAMQLRPMYENLLGVAPNGEFRPGLATEWSLEPDGQSMRVKLRKGVQFHGGNGEFSADDLINFYDEFITFDKAHVFSRIFWKKHTESIEKVSDNEVIFRMKQPNAFLMLGMSDRWNQIPIVSKKDWATNGAPTDATVDPLAGTGPYQFTERKQGQYIRFERTPGEHWRITPDFPELEFRWINETSTRLSALLAKEVHMANLPPDLQPQAETSGFVIHKNQNFGTRVWMQFYAGFPDPKTGVEGWPLYPDAVLLDLNVRKALNKAIQRDVVMNAFAPNGEKMILNHFHPQFAGWNPDWAKNFESEYGYDPAAARTLLAESGYNPKNPLVIKTRIRSCVVMAGCEDVTEAVAGYWQDVGVKVELITIDGAKRAALSRATRGGEAGIGEGIVDWVDVDNSSTHPVFALANRQTWHATGGVNGFATPEMYRIVGDIQSEMDWSKHTANLTEVGNLSFDGHANVPLWYLPAEATVDPDVIADYTWNGTEHGTWTHMEEIVAVKK
jgi:peptide/nickel transport system substrate-binding protein